jgi:23S rRNA pseudouridine1911/1915/1917 synthase
MRAYEFVIGPGEAGLRLDHHLTRRLPSSLSRAIIQRTIRAGEVTVGGRPVKAHYRLRAGDVVSARLSFLQAAPKDLELKAEQIPLTIVYEDREALVVDKPPGLVTHPAPGHWDGTLVNALLWHLQQGGKEPRLSAGDAPLPRAGIVHRLDKDTSGLLLVAKTALAHTALSRQLKSRQLHRRYLALALGHLPLDAGTITAPIGRHAAHRKEMTVRHLGGRHAVTHYRVIQRGARASETAPGQSLPYTVLAVSLETGRTHQIRVHLAHLGYPVLGDPTYGKAGATRWSLYGIGRQLLHAYQMRFQHPGTGRPVTVTAAIPEDIAAWVAPAAIERLSSERLFETGLKTGAKSV